MRTKPRTRKLKTRKTRDEGRRGVLRQLDAIAATKRELQRISTIYVGGKKVTCALARAKHIAFSAGLCVDPAPLPATVCIRG